MLYACSVLYKSRLPLVMALNKVWADVTELLGLLLVLVMLVLVLVLVLMLVLLCW